MSKYAIMYLLSGETYTYTSCHFFACKEEAVNKMKIPYDKIIAVFKVDLKQKTK